MAWTIRPGQGLGPLALDMSPDDIAALPDMGRPGHVYRGRAGQAMEYRGLSLPICEYRHGRLYRIVAGRHVAGVQFAGVDLFATDPRVVLRLLETRLGPATLFAEQVHLAGAGLCVEGFYDPHDHSCFDPRSEYHDERSVTLYVPDAAGPEDAVHEPLSFL